MYPDKDLVISGLTSEIPPHASNFRPKKGGEHYDGINGTNPPIWGFAGPAEPDGCCDHHGRDSGGISWSLNGAEPPPKKARSRASY
jgi:hypothetical protein